MRSTTLVTMSLFSALLAPGCGKDPPTDTMGGPTSDPSGADSTTGDGGGSETSAGSTSEGPVTTTTPVTSGAETGEPGSTGAAETGNFIVTPDGGTSECSNWDQDCPEGQKCMPWNNNGGTAWNATKCVPVNEAKGQVGDECTTEGGAVSGLDTCDLGIMCWDVKPDTMKGTCVAQCKGSQEAPECSADTTCFVSNDGVLNLCLPACDPLAQDCASENLCIPNPNDQQRFTCVLDASGDEGQAFDPCEFINACDKGLLCAQPALGSECDPQAIGCCLPFCDLSEMVDCPGANQECLPWYDPIDTAPPGFEGVGYCGIPM